MTAFDPTKPVQTPRMWWLRDLGDGLKLERPEDAISSAGSRPIEVIELTPAVREALVKAGVVK